EVVDFPEWIKSFSRSENGAVWVEHEEEQWGVRKKRTPTSTAPLPRTLAKLELGMSKAQILTVYPDAEIGGRHGSFRMEKGNELHFSYNDTDDDLFEISLMRYDMSVDEAVDQRRRLTDEFGPGYTYFLRAVDNKPPSFADFWQDGSTELVCELELAEQTSCPVFSTSIRDLRLAKTAQDELDKEVKRKLRESGWQPPAEPYKEAPSDYSFFLPGDLI